MIVVLTAEAESDLESIGDYVAQDNPGRALTFVRDLREQCETLADFPNRFPLVPRYERQGVRRRVFGNYAVFYRTEASRVVVLHILHGARDYEGILPEEF